LFGLLLLPYPSIREYSYQRNLSLFRYIVDNKELFAGKNIVELGAGAGLSGLVAAHYGIIRLRKKLNNLISSQKSFID